MTRRQSLFALAILALLAFLPGLGSHDLWNPDEPRYAEVAREMTATGDYLIPHLSGRIYAEKPPLFFWLIAASGEITGELDEWSIRYPSMLAAIGATLLVYLLGLLFFEPKAAFMSALVYLTCAKVLWQGHAAQIDMTLGFWVVLAMYLWARGRPRLSSREKGPFPWGFWVVTGLATLTKGPVGLLPVLLAIFVFSMSHSERSEWARLRIGRGLLLWLGVVLLWLVPAVLVGGQEYFDVIVLKQNVGRYANPWGHLKPWYYYLTILPVDFFPWLFLLPGAMIAGRRTFCGEERRGARLAWVWILVTLLFFSVSSGKRTVYILQMYPALALLVGAGVEAWQRERRCSSLWFSIPLGTISLALFGAVVFARGRLDSAQGVEELSDHLRQAIPFVVAGLGVFLLLAAVFFVRKRSLQSVWTLALGMMVLFVSSHLLLLPQFDVRKSQRTIGERISELVPSEDPVAIFPKIEAGVLFYSEREYEVLCSEDALREYLLGPKPRWLVANREMLRRVEGPLFAEDVVRGPEVKRGYSLLKASSVEWPESYRPSRDGVAAELSVEWGYPCWGVTSEPSPADPAEL